jgi:hypothetical protein
MATKKPRQKTSPRQEPLRCPSCNAPIEKVYILHMVCEECSVRRKDDGTLSARRCYYPLIDTDAVWFGCGCDFTEDEEIEKVRPILQKLKAIKG